MAIFPFEARFRVHRKVLSGFSDFEPFHELVWADDPIRLASAKARREVLKSFGSENDRILCDRNAVRHILVHKAFYVELAQNEASAATI